MEGEEDLTEDVLKAELFAHQVTVSRVEEVYKDGNLIGYGVTVRYQAAGDTRTLMIYFDDANAVRELVVHDSLHLSLEARS